MTFAGRLAVALGWLAAVAGCATPVPALPPPAAPIDAGVELPAGVGREILVASCLDCHQLGGLALFKGFYTRDSWRALVISMIDNGAELDADEVEVLSDYLAQYFGPES